MIVVERGLKILGAQIAERPAQPGFRRRTDGPYTWINFPKAFILSNPRVAATFTALPATAQRNSDDAPQNAMKQFCCLVEIGERQMKEAANRGGLTYAGVFPLSISRT